MMTKKKATCKGIKRRKENGSKSPPTPKVVDLRLAEVSPYPHQSRIYGDLAEPQLKSLTDSMAVGGQREPIHVLPPGNAAGLPDHTVIDGHQRRAAAESLDWPTVRAVVRWDLTDASAEDIHRLFLRTNFERRQLNPMQQALVIVAIHESVTDRRRKYFSGDDWCMVRDQIAEYLDLSQRNAMRYVRVLNTPEAIQIAVRDGRLTCLSLAEKVEKLPADQQEELAAKIEQIDNPRAAKRLVEQYVPPPKSRHTLKANMDRLCTALDIAAASIGPQIDGITHPSWSDYIRRLEPGMEMVERLVEQLRSIDPDADPIADVTSPE